MPTGMTGWVLAPLNWKCGSCEIHLRIIRCRTQKYCSRQCMAKMQSEQFKGKGNPFYGKTHTKEFGRKISLRNKSLTGEKALRWIKDRSKVVKKQQRNDPAYFSWRRSVWQRDSWKCKISNQDCCGKIEAHHILSWKEHLELRYEINNGITLCHFHHPRKRTEEERLSPYFQNIVSQINNIDISKE